jgi:2-methylcitrate dehydratase PrpD
MTAPSISRQFARWAANLKYEDLPAPVVDKIKALLLHALTGGVLGAHSAHAQSIFRWTLAEEGKPDGATVFHTAQKATRMGAAFANSELIHASYLFDSYRMLTHPGPVLIPAALANAELGHKNGQDLIVALAVGYELVCRLADDFIPSTAARGFRPGPIYSTLGAALVSGKLLDLDEDGLVATIALAANFASGLNEGPRVGGNELLIHEPQASRNGVFAGMMAREGHIKGAEHSLEGDAGFFNAFTGSSKGKLSYSFTGQKSVDMASITAGLGADYKLLTFMFRMYPCAGYNQPVIDLMREMKTIHGLQTDDIEEIHVAMNWIETLYPSPAFPRFTDWQHPRAGETTHYFAAYAAVHGEFPVAGAQPPASASREPMRDPAAMAFMERVKLVPQKERPMFSPAITVILKNGTRLEGDYPYDRMSWNFNQLVSQLQACLPGFPSGKAGFDALVNVVRQVDSLPSMQAIFELLTESPT